MKIRNLTPHAVTLQGVDGKSITLPPDGPAPRLSVTRTPLQSVTVDGVELPVCRPTLGQTVGLPDPEAGVILLVSALVAEANPHRSDLASPGELIRDAAGIIVGARGLCMYSK